MMKKVTLGVMSAALAFTPLLAKAQDTINPYDQNVNEFLSALHIHVDPNEYLWQQQDFVAFITKQQEVQAGYEQMSKLLKEVLTDSFDMIELGAKVNDPRFAETFGTLSEEDLAQLREAKNSIDAELDQLNIGDSLSAFFLLGFFQGLSDFGDLPDFGDDDYYYYEGDAYRVDAWADPEYVNEGNIVWLKSEVDAPLDQVSITWEQIYGPEVTWLMTDSKTDAAFIAPAYSEDEPYLEFVETVEGPEGVVERYVYVDYDYYVLDEEESL